MREKIFIIQSRPNSSRVGHNDYPGTQPHIMVNNLLILPSLCCTRNRIPTLDAKEGLCMYAKKDASASMVAGFNSRHHQIRAKQRDDTNMKEQLCQLIIYVYNMPPLYHMRRCGNVRSEKLMLIVLRGQGAKNMPN
jgi:hypothetical protein